MSTDTNKNYTTTIQEPPSAYPQDCLSCKIIGSGALGAAGLWALQSSRASAPGSVMGKRVVAGVGVCEYMSAIARSWDRLQLTLIGLLAAGAFRWTRW